MLGVNRSNYYYQPVPASPREIDLMRRIDEIYTEFPYYGSPKITEALRNQQVTANHKMVERLMREMGLAAIVPKKNLSKDNPLHFKYPYLLKNMPIIRPNQVWGTDITYVRLEAVRYTMDAQSKNCRRGFRSWHEAGYETG